MRVLEKILEEIENEITRSWNFYNNEYRQGLQEAQKIIRSHMEDEPASNSYKLDDGWIPIEEGLPPIGKPLVVTIKDNLQGKPNERRYPVYYEKDSVRDGYHWSWRYGDFAYELLPDVSEVIAWQPLPVPYQPKEEKR